MDSKKAMVKLNAGLGRVMAGAAAKWHEDALRGKEFMRRYPERIVYPSGPRFSVTWKGALTAYKLTLEQSSNSQKPYFVNLHDPREMLADDVAKLDEVDAEIKKLNEKRQRLLKKSFARAAPVPVEWALKMTGERNAWVPGAK